LFDYLGSLIHSKEKMMVSLKRNQIMVLINDEMSDEKMDEISEKKNEKINEAKKGQTLFFHL
jgi:hypothetical protein